MDSCLKAKSKLHVQGSLPVIMIPYFDIHQVQRSISQILCIKTVIRYMYVVETVIRYVYV
jgi:hypothetical protein